MIEPGRQLSEQERQERAAENARISAETMKRASELRNEDIATGREQPLMPSIQESIKRRIEGDQVIVPPNVEDSLGQGQ